MDIKKLFDLSEKTVIITGGAGLLGSQYADGLSQVGANIVLADIEGRITIDNLKWNGLAKKMGVETGDVISEFKIENLDRPNKAVIYPFSLLILL